MTMRDDDNLMGERLGRALEGEARRDPLPFDFATSIAARVEDRPARRLSWFSGIPAMTATVVLVIVVVAVPLSLTRPSTTSGPGTVGPPAEQSGLYVGPSAALSSPPALQTADASPQALTETEAVDAARGADGRPGMTAANVEHGPASEVLPREDFEWARFPSDDRWVWLVVLSDGGPPIGAEGSIVVLDYFDGTIYGIQKWIS